jgi:hypothetical protein
MPTSFGHWTSELQELGNIIQYHDTSTPADEAERRRIAPAKID